MPQLLVARVPIAVTQVVARARGEDHRFLRHDRDALANVGGIGVAQVDSVEQHAAGLRIVKAFGELEEGRLAGARGTDEREPLARADVQREVVQRRCVGARRVAERHILELERAQRGIGQCHGLGGRRDVGLGVEQLRQAFGRAGGAQQVAIDFGEVAERTGEQAAVKNKGRNGAAGHAARRRPGSRPPR